MQKRGGVGYMSAGFASAAPGACAIECPPCPRDLPALIPLTDDDFENPGDPEEPTSDNDDPVDQPSRVADEAE